MFKIKNNVKNKDIDNKISDNEIISDLIDLIKNNRIKRDLSLQDLAKETMLSVDMLTKIENKDLAFLERHVFLYGYLSTLAKKFCVDNTETYKNYHEFSISKGYLDRMFQLGK